MSESTPPLLWEELLGDVNRCIDALIPKYTEDMDLATSLVEQDSPWPGRRRWVIQIEDMRDEITEQDA